MEPSDSVTNWLLERENPSVRYFTLVDLLDTPIYDAEVEQARGDIMRNGQGPLLLEGQSEAGSWGLPGSFYNPRFTGATWRFMLLAEFGADGADPRIQKTAEYLFANSQLPNGGFWSVPPSKRSPEELGLPCLTGNMIWSLIRLGYLNDPRVQQGIDWIFRYSRFDDGDAVVWPAWLPQNPDDGCWGRHSCFRGVVAHLQALAEIPPGKRSLPVQQTIAAGVEFLLRHHVYKHSHDLSRAVGDYTQIGFPIYVDNDMLRMLLILTKLGVRDERMQEAIDLLKHKRTKDGKWKQQHTYRKTRNQGFLPVPVTEKGQPSKWVTLKALTVLKRFSLPGPQP